MSQTGLTSWTENCYMLIQILQSKGQLLASGARPVVGGLGRVERSLKLAHSVT
jgi:hypothetical protein